MRKGYITIPLNDGATVHPTTMKGSIKLEHQIHEIVKMKDNTKIPISFLIRSNKGNNTNSRNISIILRSTYTLLANDLYLLTCLFSVDNVNYVS